MQIGWHRDDFVPWREEVFLFAFEDGMGCEWSLPIRSVSSVSEQLADHYFRQMRKADFLSYIS